MGPAESENATEPLVKPPFLAAGPKWDRPKWEQPYVRCAASGNRRKRNSAAEHLVQSALDGRDVKPRRLRRRSGGTRLRTPWVPLRVLAGVPSLVPLEYSLGYLLGYPLEYSLAYPLWVPLRDRAP